MSIFMFSLLMDICLKKLLCNTNTNLLAIYAALLCFNKEQQCNKPNFNLKLRVVYLLRLIRAISCETCICGYKTIRGCSEQHLENMFTTYKHVPIKLLALFINLFVDLLQLFVLQIHLSGIMLYRLQIKY